MAAMPTELGGRRDDDEVTRTRRCDVDEGTQAVRYCIQIAPASRSLIRAASAHDGVPAPSSTPPPPSFTTSNEEGRTPTRSPTAPASRADGLDDARALEPGAALARAAQEVAPGAIEDVGAVQPADVTRMRTSPGRARARLVDEAEDRGVAAYP
jgi:hypothetical protein